MVVKEVLVFDDLFWVVVVFVNLVKRVLLRVLLLVMDWVVLGWRLEEGFWVMVKIY